MKKILLILTLAALLLSLASCELIESFISSLGTGAEDGDKEGDASDGGDDGDTSGKPDGGDDLPQPKDTVTVGGLTFKLAASCKEYILTKASAGQWEYNVPALVEGLPVTEIASGAFKNHTELRSVALPDSLELINQGIFEGCKNLMELDLPFIGETGITSSANNTNSIGYFFNTERPSGADGWTGTSAGRPGTDSYIQYWVPEALKVITLRGGATCEYTFKGAQLTEAHLGAGIHYITNSLFEGQKSLVSVSCENEITSVGREAFWNCYNLKNFRITGKSAWIGMEAFENCNDLEWIILSADTTDIQNLAFNDCENFTSIFYLGSSGDFEKIDKGTNNWELMQATVYIYCETEPETEGNYWHYDADGMPLIWGE